LPNYTTCNDFVVLLYNKFTRKKSKQLLFKNADLFVSGFQSFEVVCATPGNEYSRAQVNERPYLHVTNLTPLRVLPGRHCKMRLLGTNRTKCGTADSIALNPLPTSPRGVSWVNYSPQLITDAAHDIVKLLITTSGCCRLRTITAGYR